MKVEPMNETPTCRAEFERNANEYAEQLRDGRIHISPQATRSITGLLRVRRLPNGRIDLLSIDETARLSMNLAAHLRRSLASREFPSPPVAPEPGDDDHQASP
jgi:hypothetical protein